MVFCNKVIKKGINTFMYSHNPYFNRWFSAISIGELLGWKYTSHNPYFNRWFSAIEFLQQELSEIPHVTILILIDGFLQ